MRKHTIDVVADLEDELSSRERYEIRPSPGNQTTPGTRSQAPPNPKRHSSQNLDSLCQRMKRTSLAAPPLCNPAPEQSTLLMSTNRQGKLTAS